MSLDIATNILDNLFPPFYEGLESSKALDYQRGHLLFDFGKEIEILSYANDFHSIFGGHPSFATFT